MSQTKTQLKTVRTEKNRPITAHAAYIQNEPRAMIGVVLPTIKLMAFVKLVIVMEEPALAKATLNLFSMGSFKFVWSRALQMTNMSSAPMPISKNESKLCTPAVLNPMVPAIPHPAV